MPKFVALLGGINLGKRRLKMESLRGHFEDAKLGFQSVETLLASGNVLFDASSRGQAKMETTIETHLATVLGYAVPTYVRSAAEIRAVLKESPSVPTSGDDSSHQVQVLFFKEPLPPNLAESVVACQTDRDRFSVAGREVYWIVEGKLSDSKVWQSPEMKALKLPNSTMRNLNTVVKLSHRIG